MKRTLLRIALAGIVLLMSYAAPPSSAIAGTTGNMGGYITDSSTGKRVPSATIVATSQSAMVTTTSDAGGHYIFLALPPDDYTLTVKKEGYTTQDAPGYTILADQTQIYDVFITPASAPPQRIQLEHQTNSWGSSWMKGI